MSRKINVQLTEREIDGVRDALRFAVDKGNGEHVQARYRFLDAADDAISAWVKQQQQEKGE